MHLRTWHVQRGFANPNCLCTLLPAENPITTLLGEIIPPSHHKIVGSEEFALTTPPPTPQLEDSKELPRVCPSHLSSAPSRETLLLKRVGSGARFNRFEDWA